MAAPTTRQLEGRLIDVEGALADERGIREQQLAEIDEELESHAGKLATLMKGCQRIVRRMAELRRTVRKLGRK